MAMNGSRVAPSAGRPAAYEDSLFHMISKGFGDGGGGIGGSMSTASLVGPHSTGLDQYSQVGVVGSGVFDPNEFPSLGGAGGHPSGLSLSTSALLAGTSALDSSGLGMGPSTVAPSLNGLAQFSDLYGMGGYGDGRTKAVDALTGTGVSTEFSMHNEDFPALGGAPAPGGGLGGGLGGGPGGIVGSGPNGLHSTPSTAMEGLGVADPYFGGAGGTSMMSSAAQSRLQAALGRASMHLRQSGGVPNASPNHALGRGGQNGTMAFQANKQPVSHAHHQIQQQDRTMQQQHQHVVAAAAMAQQMQQQQQQSQPLQGMPPNLAQSLFEGIPSSAQLGAKQTLAPMDTANGPVVAANGPSDRPGGRSSLVSRLAAGAAEPTDPVPSALPLDQYGMRGLLRVAQPGPEAEDVSILSMGVDLTALGLNLNSQEPLHLSFESPWDGGQGGQSARSTVGDVASALQSVSGQRTEEPEFHLPTCYYMQPPALKTSHFTKFQLETLFYVFYNMPRDVLQLLAAVELYTREWRYHKDLKLWFTRAPGTTQGYERGAYIYFDIKSWERRPFHDANHSFIQGLMTEEELHSARIPAHMSNA